MNEGARCRASVPVQARRPNRVENPHGVVAAQGPKVPRVFLRFADAPREVGYWGGSVLAHARARLRNEPRKLAVEGGGSRLVESLKYDSHVDNRSRRSV
eukprot:2333021-Pyramimonas_sp.AAC.1